MPNIKCLTGGLQEYVPSPSKPWNDKRIHHLFNKLSNGAPLTLINLARSNSPSVLIDYLFTTAAAHPLPGEKKTGVKTIDYTYAWKEQSIAEDTNAYYKYLELVHMWFSGMISEGLRHKLVLFWSNHFVTGADEAGNRPSWVFQYYYLLHKHALGDFRDFVKAIGLTPSMLIYLDGRYNTRTAPNENYARELLELFTMGVGNYTQQDIAETARLLTGWYIRYYESPAGSGKYYIAPTKVDEFYFNRNNHDWKGKFIFGQAIGNNGGKIPPTDAEAIQKARTEYELLHDELIFKIKKNEVARFICRKLYKYYVYQNPPDDIIDGLATVFINSNFNISTVLKTLFKSEHFFDDATIGLGIKSHIENQLSYFRNLDMEEGKDYYRYKWLSNSFKADVLDPTNFPNTLNRDTLSNIYSSNTNLGQRLFNPVNVAGWPGYRTWLNEFTLVNRWKYNRDHFTYYLQYDRTKEKFREFLKTISQNSQDPDAIVRAVVTYFLAVDIPEEYIQTAVGVFKALVPENYYQNGTWTLNYTTVPSQFINLMNYLITLPEFQLL
ncbi:MAG: DUF1800 domain-containing protein [Saprospiraceae bacterium]|nr:DUF1800 domain-containing protein [Saprospiraceae bacterium]